MLHLLVLFGLLPGAMAKGYVIPLGSFSNAANGVLFGGTYWFLTLYMFIMYVVLLTALKIHLSKQEILAFGRDTAIGLFAGTIVTEVARCLFCLPTLLDIADHPGVEYDHTDENTLMQLAENRKADQCNRKRPYPCAQRSIFKQTLRYWPGLFFTFGGILIVQAVYLFRGSYDTVYDNPDTIGAVVLVIGGLMVVAAVVDMIMRPTPWSHRPDNRVTLKYLVIFSLIMAVPVFYDSILPGAPLVKGLITAAIYAGVWGVFYGYAAFVWPDHILYGRPQQAMWFAIIGALPNVIGYVAGGIANDQYPQDSFIAAVSQVIAGAVTIVFYILIRLVAHDGYVCCTEDKYQ